MRRNNALTADDEYHYKIGYHEQFDLSALVALTFRHITGHFEEITRHVTRGAEKTTAHLSSLVSIKCGILVVLYNAWTF